MNGLKQQTEVAAVVWDGARSHRHELVCRVGLPLIGLPPYSPELNPAERVFEEVRRWIEGKVYPSLEDKVAAVEAYLTELESNPDRVRGLAGWDWIEDAIQRLPTRFCGVIRTRWYKEAKAWRIRKSCKLPTLLRACRFTEVNDRACDHYGYALEEFLTMDIFDLEADPPMEDEVRQLYENTPVGQVVEVYGTNKTRDGTTFPVHVRFSKLDEEFAIANVRDITDQKAMDRMKDEFVSTVSHELGTPLTSINGFLELIMDGSTDSLDEDQRRHLEGMRRNTDRLEGLVNDLLDFSQLEGGMLTLKQWNFPIGDVVTQVIGEMRSDIEGKKLKVLWSDDKPHLNILGDRPRVVQIFANLLGNAVKYSPAESSIEIDVNPFDGGSAFLKVDVRDHGLGIAGEDISNVFHRFHRVDNSTTRSTTGTGLGLAITKALVELHGGEIWVESEAGTGSIFSFTLPLGGEA